VTIFRSVAISAMVVILGLGLVAACTQPTPTPTVGATPAQPTPEPLPETLGTVSVLGVWGSGELESFQTMIQPWEEMTGGSMEFEGTRDLTAVLRTRIAGDNPPDVAILPNPALMEEFARAGHLQPLDEMLDMDAFQRDYSQSWRDLGTIDGNLYGVFMKAANKSTVWYNPKEFQANNYTVPENWEDLTALSDQMVQDGKTPWSMAMESGASGGWPASDWIAEIVLNSHGPEFYDQWVAHEVPWTDPRIKEAFERFGQVAHTEGYVAGGVPAILSTNFMDGAYLPFMDPPRSMMYYLGSFTQGFIEDQFPDLVPVEDYDFFSFPVIANEYDGSVTGGADVVVVFRNNPTTASFVEYLASAEAQSIWVEGGGFTSINRSVPPESYPDALAAKAAEQLATATSFRFGAGDMMPAQVQSAFWAGLLDYLQNPNDLDQILQGIEGVAQDAYEN
jgi:alpha-glucoside transport system substrate-binding protein